MKIAIIRTLFNLEMQPESGKSPEIYYSSKFLEKLGVFPNILAAISSSSYFTCNSTTYYILYIALFEESTRRWSFEPRRAIKDPKTAPGEQDALLVSNSSQQVLSVYFMTHMFSQEHWESHIYWGPGPNILESLLFTKHLFCFIF